MKNTALYVSGKIVVADSHFSAYQKLTIAEQRSEFISGVFDSDTEEFESDQSEDHFYDKEIVLVRHGLTDSNDPDPNITEQGVEQTRQLALELKQIDLQGFVGKTSPLLRCLQTCELLSNEIDIPFEIEPNIAETGPEYTIPNRKNDFPQFQWPDSNFDTKIETPEIFEQRVKMALQSLPHKSILVTHLGVVCNLAKFALCPNKVTEMMNGFQPSSATIIKRQEWQQMDHTGETLYQESLLT